MIEKIRDAVIAGLKEFPPDYWLRYIERIVPSILNTSDENEIFLNVKYHTQQVHEIYHEDIERRGQAMPDEYDLALARHRLPKNLL